MATKTINCECPGFYRYNNGWDSGLFSGSTYGHPCGGRDSYGVLRYLVIPFTIPSAAKRPKKLTFKLYSTLGVLGSDGGITLATNDITFNYGISTTAPNTSDGGGGGGPTLPAAYLTTGTIDESYKSAYKLNTWEIDATNLNSNTTYYLWCWYTGYYYSVWCGFFSYNADWAYGPWSVSLEYQAIQVYYGVNGEWKECEVYYGQSNSWKEVSEIKYGLSGSWK